MKTYLKKQKFSLLPGNLIFLEINAGKIEATEALTPGEKPNNPIDFYKENKDKLAKGTKMEANIAKTFQAFDKRLGEDIAARYDEGFDKIKTSLPQFKDSPELWNEMIIQGATTVRIVEKGSGYVFKFEDANENDILEKIAKDRTQIPVTLDEDKISQREAAKKTAEQRETKRNMHWNKETGLITFTGNAEEKWKKTLNISLNSLFPAASEGSMIQVTAPNQAPRTATLRKGVWTYSNGEKAKIFDGYKVHPQWTTEYQEEKPQLKLQPGETLLEQQPRKLTEQQLQKALAGNLNWNEIAQNIFKEKPELTASGISIEQYAKILQSHSTDTGYYWLIMPNTTSARNTEEALKKYNTEVNRTSARRSAESRQEEARSYAIYDKYKNFLWEDTKLIPGDNVKLEQGGEKEFRDIIESEAKWKEAWNSGTRLDSAMIMRAFKKSPYDRIPETTVRDTLREVMDYGAARNGIAMSYFFEAFNKTGKLYKTLDGKPADLDDLKDEYQLFTETIPAKIKENQQAGKAINDGFDEKENKALQQMEGRKQRIMNILVGAAGIFDSIFKAYKPKSARKAQGSAEWVRTNGEFTTTAQDKKYGDYYKDMIVGRKHIELTDQAETAIKDKETWDKMWKNNEGNVEILKRALQRAPYKSLSTDLQRDRLYDAIRGGRRFSTYRLNMSLILHHLNKDGELYKNADGEPGSYKDFREEFTAEQIGDKVRKGKANAEEIKWYNKQPNKNELGDRYAELSELFISTAYVLNAVDNLKPSANYTEAVPEAQKAEATLNDVFPPNNTGNTAGHTTDYYDTGNEEGFRSAFKLFRYDLSDVKMMSGLDEVSSSATANAILRDQCRTPEGKIDQKKLELRINELIKLGIINLLTQQDKTENKEKRANALKLLGIDASQVSNPGLVNQTFEKFKISLTQNTSLSEIQKELVRLGFILETKVRPGEVKEVGETPKLSDDPQIRQLQLQAIEQGADSETAEKMEKDIMVAILHLKIGKNFSKIDEAGITIPLKLAGDESKLLYIAISPAYDFDNDKLIIRGGLGGSLDIAKNVALVGGVGASSEGKGYVGAGFNWEIPVDKDTVWKPDLTVGAVLSANLSNLKDNNVTLGFALKWSRDKDAQYREDLAENLQAAGLDAVEKEKNIDRKAQLLLELPGPTGAALTELKTYLNLSNVELVSFYETHIKNEIAQETRREGLSQHKVLGFLPPVTDVGFGVALSIDPTKIIPGVGFGISIGSKLIVFQRPTRNTADMQQLGANRMEQQAREAELKKAFAETARSAGYTEVEYQTFHSETVVGDRESGFKPVRTESSTSQSLPEMDASDAKLDQIFQNYNKELAKNGMHLEKVGDMYKLTIDNIGNVQIYMDPAMQEKMGLFIKNGELYLSASKNPSLVIKRLDLYYPRPKEGNVKHTFITISDANLRTAADIMNSSDFMIESRTKDNTGAYRTPYRLTSVAGNERPTQNNIREWKQGENYSGYDNLTKETAETKKYRESLAQVQRYRALGENMRNNIGSADLAIDIAQAEQRARTFMENNKLLYRQYTTYQLTSKPQLKKLDDKIREENPGISDDELYGIKEELFHMSMAESKKSIEKLPQEKQKERIKQIVEQRLEWMKKTIYIPFFKEFSNGQNNPNNYSAEELAESFVAPIRFAYLNEMQKLPVGAQMEIAVGTMNVRGRRQFTVAQPENIEDHGIRPAKDYRTALETGQPPMDHTVALILRESVRPIDQLETDEILRSPLATKLLLLGTAEGNAPVLIDIMGETAYKKLTECYAQKPPKAIEGSEEAIAQLTSIAKQLAEAQEGKGTLIQVDGKNYQSITIGNTVLAIRTDMLQSGIYERCFNATSAYNDEVIAISKKESYEIVGNAQVYRGAATNSLVSSNTVAGVNIGLGATADIVPGGGEEGGGPAKPKRKPAEGRGEEEGAGTGNAGETTGGGADTVAEDQNTPPASLE